MWKLQLYTTFVILFTLLNIIIYELDAATLGLNRVVGGVDVPKGQYIPYQVSLQYHMKNGEYQHFCGGSIITANRILTAAHCCRGLQPQRMSILAGVRDLRNERNGQRANVTSYDIHENYQELVTSDIAIINIDPSLVLDGVSMAAINVTGIDGAEIGGGVPVTLSGWGLRLPLPIPFLPSTWETLNYPTTLQTITYYTITNRQCRDNGMRDLTDTEICAQGIFLRAACSGDSGGPLVTQMKDGSLHQVGIVSYGLMICGVFDVPDVYTRVSMFDKWIMKRMM